MGTTLISTIISIIGLVIALGLGIWLLFLNSKLNKLKSNYEDLLRGSDKKSLDDIIKDHLDRLDQGLLKVNELEESLKSLRDKSHEHFQKFGFKRFNPLNETGGDQSFALALLDEENNGVIISTIHSREATRMFAKRVEKGVSVKYKLSKEEEEVLHEAARETRY